MSKQNGFFMVLVARITNTLPALILLASAALMTGCASSNAGNVYSRDAAQAAHVVKTGVVEQIRAVRIEGTKSYVGTAAGAAVGGLAGRGVGGGTGRDIATVAGAVAGGLAGAASEEMLTRRAGLEIIVRLDNGQTMAVVQEDGGENFFVGQQVRVLERGGTFRVTP